MNGATPSVEGDIVRSATGLFAELGYDGTTLDLVASASGHAKDEVVRIAGDKRDLYLRVMRNAYEEEMAALAPVVSVFTPTRASVAALVDAYLDFCLSHPHIPALWMHRWLADGADFSHLEDLYVKPTHEVLEGLLRDLMAPGVDVEMAVWTVVWSVHGYIGAMHRGVRDDAGQLRAHLHVMIDKFLRPDPA